MRLWFVRSVGSVPLFALFAALALGGCSDDGGAEGADEAGSEGEELDHATLVFETDATALCAEGADAVELATRRRDCFDPPLPCTVAQDPPWVLGTAIDCAELEAGTTRFEVRVMQTGRWETQLRSVGGGALLGQCAGQGGDTLADVGRDALAEGAELPLDPVAAGACTPEP